MRLGGCRKRFPLLPRPKHKICGALQLWKSDGAGGFTHNDWGVVPTNWTVQA